MAAETLTEAIRFAQARALTCRARGLAHEHERGWLDMLVLLERAAAQRADLTARPQGDLDLGACTLIRDVTGCDGPTAVKAWDSLDPFIGHLIREAVLKERADLTARLTEPDVIEAVLREHADRHGVWPLCSCGWSGYPDEQSSWAAHVAAAVRDALTGGDA